MAYHGFRRWILAAALLSILAGSPGTAVEQVRLGLARLLQREKIVADVPLEDLRLDDDESAVTFTLEQRRFRFELKSGTLCEVTEPPGNESPPEEVASVGVIV